MPGFITSFQFAPSNETSWMTGDDPLLVQSISACPEVIAACDALAICLIIAAVTADWVPAVSPPPTWLATSAPAIPAAASPVAATPSRAPRRTGTGARSLAGG